MTTTPFARRVSAGLCISLLALTSLAGCDRRDPEIPAPAPGSPSPMPSDPPPGTSTTPGTTSGGTAGGSSGGADSSTGSGTGGSAGTVPSDPQPAASAASQ